MVISYFDALNAFLTIYNNLPNAYLQLVVLALMILAAIKILMAVSGL